MLIRKSETGEFMVRPTTVAFVYGFNSKDIHDKASKLFGKIGRMKYYNLVRVQIGALQYWEAKLCQ